MTPAFLQDRLSISLPGLQVWPPLSLDRRGPSRIHTHVLNGSTDRSRVRAVGRPQPTGLNGERTLSPCSRPPQPYRLLSPPFLPTSPNTVRMLLAGEHPGEVLGCRTSLVGSVPLEEVEFTQTKDIG